MGKRIDPNMVQAQRATAAGQTVTVYVTQEVDDDLGNRHYPGEPCEFTKDAVERGLRPYGLVTTERAFKAQKDAERAREEADAELAKVLGEEGEEQRAIGVPGQGAAATEYWSTEHIRKDTAQRVQAEKEGRTPGEASEDQYRRMTPEQRAYEDVERNTRRARAAGRGELIGVGTQPGDRGDMNSGVVTPSQPVKPLVPGQDYGPEPPRSRSGVGRSRPARRVAVGSAPKAPKKSGSSKRASGKARGQGSTV
jgi:hypothetical protein